jgi:hypothetical protein
MIKFRQTRLDVMQNSVNRSLDNTLQKRDTFLTTQRNTIVLYIAKFSQINPKISIYYKHRSFINITYWTTEVWSSTWYISWKFKVWISINFLMPKD